MTEPVIVITRAHVHVHDADLSRKERDRLVLTAEERRWGRRRVTTEKGRTLALALPKADPAWLEWAVALQRRQDRLDRSDTEVEHDGGLHDGLRIATDRHRWPFERARQIGRGHPECRWPHGVCPPVRAIRAGPTRSKCVRPTRCCGGRRRRTCLSDAPPPITRGGGRLGTVRGSSRG